MKELLKFLFKITLNLIGFFGLILYVWYRFIRVRLPREIPFDINYFNSMLYMLLCILYLSLIIYTLYSFRSILTEYPYNKTFLNIIFNYIKNYCTKIYKPFGKLFYYIYFPSLQFDTYIKEHFFFNFYYKKFILYIIKFFPIINPDKGYSNPVEQKKIYIFYLIFYLIFFMLIRITFITTFIFDIFYFHYLYYIYKIIPLTILLVLAKYFLYSLTEFKKKQIEFLEYACCAVESDDWVKFTGGYYENYAQEINIAPNCMEPRYFIEQQIEYMIYWFYTFNFSAGTTPKYTEECKKKYNFDLIQTSEKLQVIIKQEILPIAYIIEQIVYIKNRFFIKIMNLIIYILYFICFTYLLLINLFAKFCIIFVIL